jgi:DNA-binding NarL/FixJ family response regulator
MLVTARGVSLASAPAVSAVLFTLRRLASDHEPDRCDPGADHVPSTAATLGELDGLTPQQLIVLRLIGEGLSTDQIAAKLYRTPKTIEWHRMSLGRKLGVRSRAELVLIAVRTGLVSPDEIVLHRDHPDDQDEIHAPAPEPDEPPDRL